jgi:hypothetical protein
MFVRQPTVSIAVDPVGFLGGFERRQSLLAVKAGESNKFGIVRAIKIGSPHAVLFKNSGIGRSGSDA